MIDIFQLSTITPKDKSVEYLGQIFGSMSGVIPSPSAGAISLLGTMFKTFNSVVLAVGALILVYVTVVGVMATAHEGEFMGKKWHSLWVPLRTVLGVASLVPLGSGYSAIQIIMMWVIVQGIGAADTLWNTTLSYINITGSPFAQITLPETGTRQGIRDLYIGLTCERSAAQTYDNPYIPGSEKGGYYCNVNPNAPFCKTGNKFNPDAKTYSIGPNGACGKLSYCDQKANCTDANSLKCLACKAQVVALEGIVATLSGVGNQLAQSDYEYQNYYLNGAKASQGLMGVQGGPTVQLPAWVQDYCSAKGISECTKAGGLPSPNSGSSNASDNLVSEAYWPYAIQPKIGPDNFVDTVVTYYTDQIQGAITTFIQQQGTDNSKLSKRLKAAQETGWIFAGSYYYTIAQINNDNFNEALPSFEVVSNDPSGDPNNILQGYRNNNKAAAALLDAASGQVVSSSSAVTGGTMNAASGTVNDIVTITAKGVKSGSNPLAQLQQIGNGMLIAAQILFVVLVAVAFIVGLSTNIAATALGTGPTTAPFSGAAVLTYFFLVPLMYGVLGILVTYGGLLSIYVPLIPYVVFTMGAVGWFLSTIEAMVAGPLVALGVLSPGGQHEVLGKAEPALLLLFNIFLRPSLMIFGLLAALLLSSVVVNMINYAFWSIAVEGIYGMNMKGKAVYGNPLALLLFTAAWVGLIVIALNKCFAAIYIIPEQVMRWIGGHGERYGEAEAVGETKQGVTGAAAGAKGGMQAARRPGEETAERKAKHGKSGGGDDTTKPNIEGKK